MVEPSMTRSQTDETGYVYIPNQPYIYLKHIKQKALILLVYWFEIEQ